MQQQHLSRTTEQLKRVLSPELLRQLGAASGLVVRERLITAERLVPSILRSLGSRRVASLAELTRDFNADHQLAVHYKPFYEKLDTPAFPTLMQAVFDEVIRSLHSQALDAIASGPFAKFKDIVVQDGTSFAIHHALANVFPGRFRDVSPAAVELHCTMSLFKDTILRLAISPDSTCERHYLPEPEQLKGKLLLADRGYDDSGYMERVNNSGGSFVMRVRKSMDPIVVKIHARGRKYRRLEGQRLSRVLRAAPKRDGLDMDICWEKKGDFTRPARLVAVYNSDRKHWVRLMTNLNREDFSLDDIQVVYRLRWQIELLFKELKSHANLHSFVTRKKCIVEGLIWAALASALLKRFIAHSCQAALEVAISTRRVAMCGERIFAILLGSIRANHARLTGHLRDLFTYLAHNAKRANLKRERDTGRLRLGLTPAGVP